MINTGMYVEDDILTSFTFISLAHGGTNRSLEWTDIPWILIITKISVLGKTSRNKFSKLYPNFLTRERLMHPTDYTVKGERN
jgi:hypothetical protein